MSSKRTHSKGITLPASIQKNDRLAYIFIFAVSIIVFVAVAFLSRSVEMKVNLGFDKHIFARINALINTFVALLLLGALYAARDKRFRTHKKLMLWAIVLSGLFLVSYICHHLFSGETPYGGSGLVKIVYFFILITHIVLAGIILPFILFTAYRGLTGEYHKHKKLARITWPLWFYVAVTGVVVYLMVSPYYT
jgi:putative membrane protein